MKPRAKPPPEAVDESAESVLTIDADGRVFAFGITGPIAAVLAAIPMADDRTRRRLEQIGRLDVRAQTTSPSNAEETR
jgi:hypothetical protein